MRPGDVQRRSRRAPAPLAGIARSGAGGRRGRAAARSGCGGPAGERLPGQCRRRGSSPQRLRRGGRPARVRHLRRAGRRGRPGNRRRADGAGDRRDAHGPAGSDGAAAAHPAAAARHGRRRRDPDAHRQETAHRELRSRSGAARGDPARRGRPRAVVLGRARARRPPARPHLGTDRTRQGHRMGDRRHGGAARPATALPGDGSEPPQGRAASRRGLSRRPRAARPGCRCTRHRRARRPLPRRRRAGRAGPAGRRGAAALRLPGAGDLRGSHRGGRGRAAGGLHGLPARDRAAGRRHRPPGAAAGPRGAGGGPASGAQRTRPGRGAGRAGGAQGARPVVGDGGRPLPRDRGGRGRASMAEAS